MSGASLPLRVLTLLIIQWRARNVDDIGPAGITPVGVSEAFIDGDLVETFLELDAARAKEVVEALNKDGEGTIAAVSTRLAT